MSQRSLDDLVARLQNKLDANDQVKAAAELGEVGTPEIAPELLKAVWHDDTSTVRQIAIQSYSEILKEKAFEEVIKVVKTHLDDYVKIYAISILGSMDSNLVTDVLAELLENTNPKIRVPVIRAMIHANTRVNSEIILKTLENETDMLVQKNLIEALAIWKYSKSFELISDILKNSSNIEIRTIALFALASFGDKNAKKELQSSEIDEYIRISQNNKTFRGRNGLLEALKNH